MDLFIPTLFTFIPVILVAFLIRWIRLIKVNSDIQVEQNKEIIALLKEKNHTSD
ncbi:hypothetical protein H0266_14580 [Halobacillus locisalis]|uniref:Uncharacterized protein n=1 Tax=Halobacillus locisalis TaxID=220753 RepID=A0A838CVX9_9BACI|nr:hypothetical protein [Halobacillus locisalis]MBA2176120.1 hypothetical protein [Halobacillus locisalis]